jgi:hypothetical protein
LKFLPVMVMRWPPAGMPMDGVTAVMLGAVLVGGGIVGLTLYVISTVRTTVPIAA